MAWVQVEADVFPAFGGGPQGMAAAFGVPFLGEQLALAVPVPTSDLAAAEAEKPFTLLTINHMACCRQDPSGPELAPCLRGG